MEADYKVHSIVISTDVLSSASELEHCPVSSPRAHTNYRLPAIK